MDDEKEKLKKLLIGYYGSSRSEDTIDELVDMIDTLIFDISIIYQEYIKIIHEENSTIL